MPTAGSATPWCWPSPRSPACSRSCRCLSSCWAVETMLALVRDVLDKQLLDRESRPFGKVDGIVLEVRADGPPRVVALEVGAATRLARLPAWLARWTRPLAGHAHATRIAKESVLAV